MSSNSLSSPPINYDNKTIIRETHHICNNHNEKHLITINGEDIKMALEKLIDKYLPTHTLNSQLESVTTCGTIDITVIRITTLILIPKDKTNTSVQTQSNASVQTQSNASVQTQSNASVQTQLNVIVAHRRLNCFDRNMKIW
jgi:hypothetical protein